MNKLYLLSILLILGIASNANAATSGLYGTEIDSDRLFTIDLTTGSATVVGQLTPPPPQVEGLAYSPSTNSFYGVDNSNYTLIEITTDPVNWTLLHVLPLGTYSNLARNPITGLLYAKTGGRYLSIIDPQTGTVTDIGSPTVSPESLAFDSTGRLFGIGFAPAPAEDNLYEFDVSTGAVLSTVEITSNLTVPAFTNSLAIHPANHSHDAAARHLY